ncbi:MAG: hypothetical protein RDU89_07170 [bacterium]|nr:hypothetical protein [bacterium]
MVIFEPPPAGPEPSLAASMIALGVYLLVLIGTLHAMWRRQEAP